MHKAEDKLAMNEKKEKEIEQKMSEVEKILRMKKDLEEKSLQMSNKEKEIVQMMDQVKSKLNVVEQAQNVKNENENLKKQNDEKDKKISELNHKLKIAISKIKSDQKKQNENGISEVLRRSFLMFVAQDWQHREQMLPGILSLLDCTDQERLYAINTWKSRGH